MFTTFKRWEKSSNSGDLLTLMCLIACFWMINLITINRSPVIWQDEVMFTDPAVNFLHGNGFTSTAWPTAHAGQLWASNSPLYSWALVPWLSIFRISITSVRSLNLFIASLACAVGWIGLRRSNLIRQPLHRFAFIGLTSCLHGVSFSYKSGRYDTLGMLLMVLLALAMTFRPSKERLVAITGICFLLPLAGMHLIIYAVVVMGAYCAVKRGIRAELFASVLGLLLGFLALYVIFTALGQWPQFVSSLSHFRGKSSIVENTLSLPSYIFTGVIRECISADILFIAFVVQAIINYQRWHSGHRSTLFSDLYAWTWCVVIVFPIMMIVARGFLRYYAWMIEIPLALAVGASLRADGLVYGWKRIAWYAIAGAFGLASLIGLPLRTCLTLREWNDRDPNALAQFIRANVSQNDVVYGEWAMFYSLKDIQLSHLNVYFPAYHDIMSEREFARVNVVCASPENEKRYLSDISTGSTWRKVAIFGQPVGEDRKLKGEGRTYSFSLFRREVLPD